MEGLESRYVQANPATVIETYRNFPPDPAMERLTGNTFNADHL
jgi:hypothetical protein